jgi:hypothetical protein
MKRITYQVFAIQRIEYSIFDDDGDAMLLRFGPCVPPLDLTASKRTPPAGINHVFRHSRLGLNAVPIVTIDCGHGTVFA